MMLTPVRVGNEYQAELPELLPLSRRGATPAITDGIRVPPPPTHRWTPSRFSSDEVEEFLRSFCRLNEVELGLQCLMQSEFHVQSAVQLLHDARRSKARAQRAECEHVSDEAFGSAVAAHGKRFFVIQREFEHMTTGDVVRRFYLWKTSSAYRIWRERAKSRRGKECARLRTWDESEGSEASDFHNEYCALCFTGGQLLCCDGCERAYHFSCVSPPIKEVPNGDWFCAHCSVMLATSVSVRQSAENAHCKEMVVVDAESDGDTLDLEDIDDEDEDEDGDEEDEEDEDGGGGSHEEEEESGGVARAEAAASRRRGAAQERPPRAPSSSTDNDESDDGRVKLEPRAAPSQQPLHQAARRLADARRLAKPALALEPSASERKRKRKIEAPRRIPQLRNF